MKLLIILSSLIVSTFGCRGPRVGVTVCNCHCGRRTIIPGIQGSLNEPSEGQKAEKNQFPYQVGLYTNKLGFLQFCSGTLISDQWILTAAHCLLTTKEIFVILGTLNSDGTNGKIVRTSTYFIHENYSSLIENWNDIALIKLDSPVDLSDSIQPADLPDSSEIEEGTMAVASGWGQATNRPTTLEYENVPVLSMDECKNYLGESIGDSLFCIGKVPELEAKCFGNSGSPVFLGNTSTLIGIAAVALDAPCEFAFPAGLTKISSYLDWIESITDIST